jgi:hypothetical protein
VTVGELLLELTSQSEGVVSVWIST